MNGKTPGHKGSQNGTAKSASGSGRHIEQILADAIYTLMPTSTLANQQGLLDAMVSTFDQRNIRGDEVEDVLPSIVNDAIRPGLLTSEIIKRVSAKRASRYAISTPEAASRRMASLQEQRDSANASLEAAGRNHIRWVIRNGELMIEMVSSAELPRPANPSMDWLMNNRGRVWMTVAETGRLNEHLESVGAHSRYRQDGSRYRVDGGPEHVEPSWWRPHQPPADLHTIDAPFVARSRPLSKSELAMLRPDMLKLGLSAGHLEYRSGQLVEVDHG